MGFILKFTHSPFKLCWFLITLVYMNTSMPCSSKMGCTIKVKGSRETVLGKYLLTYGKTAIKVFFFLEEAIERFACGIVGREK